MPRFQTNAKASFQAVDICNRGLFSLVPRPSPAPVFDRLQYAKTEPAQFLHAELAQFLHAELAQFLHTELAQFLHTASDQKPKPGKTWERG